MKMFSGILAMVLSATAFAQTTTITASNEKAGGVPVALGTVTFIGTNVRGVAIPFTDASGGNQPATYSCQLVNGAITGALGADGTTITGPCVVPDSAQTTPANIDYVVQVCDTSSGVNRCYPSMLVPFVTGATFALDHFAPSAQTASSTPMQAAIGAAVPSSCVAPAIFTLTGGQSPVIYTCVAGSYVAASSPSGAGTVVNANVAVGKTTTLAAGTAASVTNSGTATAPVLNFNVPTGAPGATPTVTVNTVTPLAPGVQPTVSQDASSTASAVKLNFGLPTVPSLNSRGAWAANTSYAVGDTFTNGGISYVVTAAFTSGSSFVATNLTAGSSTSFQLAGLNAAAAAAKSEADALSATLAASAAHAGAPHYAVLNYGNTRTCTWTKTVTQNTQGQVLSVTYSGGVDDYSAIQAAANASGSFSTPPMTMVGGHFHNAAQGTVVFPDGQNCRSLSGVPSFPPGTLIEGNGSEFSWTATGDGLDFLWGVGGTGIGISYGYGRFFDGLRNLKLAGPDLPTNGLITRTSLGKAINMQLANYPTVEHVHEVGAKYGFAGNQMQYGNILHSEFTGNQVGCYLDADSSNTSLPTIDTNFINTSCGGNGRFALFAKSAVGNHFTNGDFGQNGSAGIVLGGQLQPYVSALAMSGGSGCTVGINRVVGTSTASDAVPYEGYFTADSSGAPVGTVVATTDGGMDITSPTFTASTCTTPPSFTPTITNDQMATGLASIGDFQGDAYGTSLNTFTGIKMEQALPLDTGYFAIVGTNGTTGNAGSNTFSYSDWGAYNTGYARQMRISNATKTGVFYPFKADGQNPALPTDTTVLGHCQYRNTVNGLSTAVKYGVGTINETNVGRQACEPNGTASPASHVTYNAYASDGSLLVPSVNLSGQNLISSIAGSSLGGANITATGSMQAMPQKSADGLFSLTFRSTASAGTNPTATIVGVPSSLGIPSGSQCRGDWRTTGTGSGIAIQYSAYASCNLGDSSTETRYLSLNTLFGSEAWVSAEEEAGSTGYFTFSHNARLSVISPLASNISLRVVSGHTGQDMTLVFCQPATGGPYTVTPTQDSYDTFLNFPTIGTTAGKCNILPYVYSGLVGKWVPNGAPQLNQ